MREATLAWYGGLERDCAKALNVPVGALDHGMVWGFLMGDCNPGATCPAWLVEHLRGKRDSLVKREDSRKTT